MLKGDGKCVLLEDEIEKLCKLNLDDLVLLRSLSSSKFIKHSFVCIRLYANCVSLSRRYVGGNFN